MTSRNKQILTAVIGVLLLIGLGVASLIVIPRLTQTDRGIAPTAPESEPAAADDWIGSASCNLQFSVSRDSCTGADFPDVTSSSPYYEAVSRFNGGACCITRGKADGTFGANDTLTRFDAVAFYARYRISVLRDWTLIAAPATPSFPDVTPATHGDEGYRLIETAKARGFIRGNADGTFKPSDPWLFSFTTPTAIGTAITTPQTRGDFLLAMYNYGKNNNQLAVCGLAIVTPTVSVTPTTSSSPTPTLAFTPTPTIPSSCGITCDADLDCGPAGSGMSCEIETGAATGICRRAACVNETDCTCPVATGTPRPTATPTTASLPDAGIGLPTLGALGGGIVMILLGILLAL